MDILPFLLFSIRLCNLSDYLFYAISRKRLGSFPAIGSKRPLN